MTSKRLFYSLSGLIAVLLLCLVFGAYNINKMLVTKANSLTTLKAKSAALEQERITLEKSKKDIQKYAELEKIAKAVVPQDKDQAQTVREIVGIANKNGVNIATISFPASTLGSGVAATGTTTPASAPSAAVGSQASALSQLQPVKNIPGVYSLLISVQSDTAKPVPYSRFISFLTDLERNRRTAQVSTISITPSPSNRNLLSFTLTLNEYVKK